MDCCGGKDVKMQCLQAGGRTMACVVEVNCRSFGARGSVGKVAVQRRLG